MKFSSSPDFLNSMANKPGIFEKVAQDWQDRIDLSLQWDHYIGLECEEGGFLCHRIEPSLYEVHTLFEAGRHVFAKAIQAAEIIFCATDCREMVTRVPINNKAALMLTEKFGWNYRYTVKGGWPGKDGVQDCHHYGMTLWDWVLKNEALAQKGHAFHEQLESNGSLTHDDDPVHDKFVGYALRCTDFGNKEKGIYEYNKWAILSNYMPIILEHDGSVSFDNITVREVA